MLNILCKNSFFLNAHCFLSLAIYCKYSCLGKNKSVIISAIKTVWGRNYDYYNEQWNWEELSQQCRYIIRERTATYYQQY